MLGNNYEVDIASDFQTFEFISVGTKGNITKVVRYTEIDIKGVFNLGFGDKNLETGHISDLIISNNGDSQKVLSTVAATLKVFMNNYPEAIVIATVVPKPEPDFIKWVLQKVLKLFKETILFLD